MRHIVCGKRESDAYRHISLYGHNIQVPQTPLREYVDVHMVPDLEKSMMDIRIWWGGSMVQSLTLPLEGFRVHF